MCFGEHLIISMNGSSSKLSAIASTPQEWTPKDLMLIAYFLGVGGIYAYTLRYLPTSISVWFTAVGNIRYSISATLVPWQL
jgi:ABC-type uncharacterized transport system permease subunit